MLTYLKEDETSLYQDYYSNFVRNLKGNSQLKDWLMLHQLIKIDKEGFVCLKKLNFNQTEGLTTINYNLSEND